MMRSMMVALALVVTAAPASAALWWIPGYHAEQCQDFTTGTGAGVACAGDVVLLGRRMDYDDVILGRVSAEIPPQMVAVDDVRRDVNDAEQSPALPRGAVAFGRPYYVTIGYAPTLTRTQDGALEVTF